MKNHELNELRKKRDELREKAAQMRMDWIRKNKKLTKKQRISALVSLIAIVIFFFFALDYIGRTQRAFEKIHKYEELVKSYEELTETDKDLLYNCADLVITEPTDENLSQNAQEANMLMEKKDEIIRSINQIRDDLGLIRHPSL